MDKELQHVTFYSDGLRITGLLAMPDGGPVTLMDRGRLAV